MKKLRTLAILNLLSYLAHLAVVMLTQFRLINPQDVGEVSDQYASVFTPAGITFAIWGVIYIGLAAFCIYHLVMAYRHGPGDPANEDLGRIGGWFVFNNLATMAWLFAWTNYFLQFSLFLIVLQLLSLVVINLRLGIHDTSRHAGSKIFTQFPMSIYFGWITIATIANASVYLTAINWDGFGLGYSAITWTMIVIALAVFITLWVVFSRRNVFYGLVVVWALYGIIRERTAVDALLYKDLIVVAWIGIGLTGMACLIQFLRNLVLDARELHRLFPIAPQSVK